MLFLFQASSYSVSQNQQNQMEEHASTTTGYTRMGKSFIQTANTSALAWTALLDASPSAHMSSCCPNWAARSRGGSRYPDGAVSNSSALRTQRQRALWWRNTGKSTAEKTAERLKTTLPTGTSWLLCGEENPSLYPVSSLTFFFLSDMCMKCLVSSFFLQTFVNLIFVPHAAFRSHPMGRMLVRGVECVSRTTAWSPCSKSCGTGVSTRVTNSNTQCKRVKETQICQIRPCSQMMFNRLKVHSTLSLS